MKNFRTIIAVIALISAISFGTLAVQAFVKDEVVKSEMLGAMAVACAFLPSVANKVSVSLGFSAGLAALERNADKLDARTIADLRAGKIQALDSTLYKRVQITGESGIFELIEASDTKEKGITNIDGDRLPEGENFAVEAIAIRQGTHATKTDPKEIANYTSVMSSVEAEVRNAEFVILLDSKEVLRLPVSSVLNGAANSLGSNKDTAYHLKDNAFVIPSKKRIEMRIEFAAVVATASASASKFHLEVELYGKKTSTK
jgi:hypothetical protein